MESSLKISSAWSTSQLPNGPVKEYIATVTTSLEFGSTPNHLTFNFDWFKWSWRISVFSMVQSSNFCKNRDKLVVTLGWPDELGSFKASSETLLLIIRIASAHIPLLSSWSLIRISSQKQGKIPTSVPKLFSMSLAFRKSPKSKQRDFSTRSSKNKYKIHP